MASTTSTWRVRSEDGTGEGRAIGFQALSEGVGDGLWPEAAQVRAPGQNQWVPIGDHPQLEEFLPRRQMFAGKSGEEAEMDMTPMIDVTFQLIIFFMITATFVVQKTLDMPRPTADQDAPAALPTLSQLQADTIVVKVLPDGGLEVDNKPVALDQLTGALREARQKKPDSAELILDVDDQVAYDVVVKVIDGAAGAEIERVHFLRRAGEQGAPEAT